MNSAICKAIASLSTIELRYNGYARVVEPYAHGRDKSGDAMLRCFQVSGGSESGARMGWKLLKLSEVYSLHVSEQHFRPRAEYRRDDKSMVNIFCQL